MYLTLYYLENFPNENLSLPSCNIRPEVYLKYNHADDSISYIVIPHHSKTLENTIYTFTINKDITSYDILKLKYKLSYNDFYNLIRFSAAVENDAFINKKANFINAFNEANKTIKTLLTLQNMNEVQNIVQTRRKFASKVNKIIESQDDLLDLNKSTTTHKCDFQVIVKIYDSNECYISLKVGYDKFYSVRNFDSFISSFDNRENVKFGKFLTLKLCPESFTDRALKLLRIIRKNFSYYEGEIILPVDEFVKVLELYKGLTIAFPKGNFLINKEDIEPIVTIDESGQFIFEPQLSCDSFNVGRQSGYMMDNKKKTITILHFSNGAQATLYELGNSLNYNFDFVEDLMTDEFKNFTHKAVHLRIKDKNDLDLKIKLYISLDLQKNVVFKTIYEYQDQEITKSEIRKQNTFDSLLLEYELRLQELNLLENGKSKDLETLNYVLLADYTHLREIADVYLSDEIAKLQKSKLQHIQIKASSGKDWLTVQVSSSDYTQEELRKILNAYKKKKKYVLLKNNFVTLDNQDELQELSDLDEHFSLSQNMENVEVPIYQIFKLASLENNEHIHVDYDQKIKDIILSIKNFSSTKVNLNDNLLKVLRPYQIEAVKRMKTLYDNHLSGILADDMGLGKSIEFISFRTLIEEKAPTLIVCPKSLIYNWRNEFKKRNPTSKCYLVDGNKTTRIAILEEAKDTNDVIIVSYDSLRSDLEQFKEIHFALVCIDEAQYIKNSFTQKSKAVKQLNSSSRFALTGTPIENALTDLWSIFDFLMPKYLSSEQNFTKEYEGSFQSEDDTLRKKLLAKITPFILRRSKDDVLTDLPPKTTEVINIAMSEKQSELYNAYVLSTRASIEENPKNKLAVLSALTRMRQICVDPSSFLENYDEISPKLEYTTNLVQNAINSGHKVLIFSQFTTVLEHLQVLLMRNDISFYYICGDTKADERLLIADRFNKSNSTKVILVSLKAGGTGLNLHGADTVVHLDPWWNYAVEDQATDRAHRIGQTRPVTVYKLVAHDSIEERVIELQESKKDLYEQVILNGSQNITNISDEDIKFLLS